MKKSLLAVAAMGAFASAAQAQSSVTVYGILDVGYTGGSSRISDSSKANTTGYNGGNQKQTVNQFSQGSEQTNRLGFKGVEDLGGGTSAFFTVEFALAPQDQDLSGNTQGGLNNRQTFVGLKKAGLGQTAIGLQYTPIFNAAAATDPGQLNNMAGNVIYASSTSISSGSAASNNTAFTNRTANTLSLKSDNFAGFTASAIYTLNNKNATQTVISTAASQTAGGNTNANGWGLGLDYTWNKLYVTAAMQQLKAQNPITWTRTTTNATGVTTGSFVVGSPVAFGVGQAATLGTNTQDNQYYVAATYDFGILKAYAQYLNRKVSLQEDSGYYLKRNAQQIGVRSYITPTIEAWASGALGKYTAYGYNNPAANVTAWQIGSNYWLSKRTNLYAIYGQTGTSNVSVLNNQNPSSTNANNYAVGVRHTF